MKADIYNQNAEKVSELELSEQIFNLKRNDDLIHQVVTSMQANLRVPVAHAKGRGEVRGGGKKPWRQKGTGRARHGSIRSPIWKGGGVTHGPTKERDFSKKINRKMKKKALFVSLSQKLRDKEILFLDKIDLTKPKTKEANIILKNLAKIDGFEKIENKKKNRFILALPEKSSLEIKRSFRNLPGVEIISTPNLNVLDILTYKYLVLVNFNEKSFVA